MREIDKLQSEVNILTSNYQEIKRLYAVMAKHHKRLTKESKKLTRSYETHRKELWRSALSGNNNMATMAERKMKEVIEGQALIQRKMPDIYKTWAFVSRMMNVAKDECFERKVKIALKEEEIHRLKPCDSVTCQHCKRVNITAFKKAKVVLKNKMARMLKTKLE